MGRSKNKDQINLSIDGIELTGNLEISEAFNNYFSNIGGRLAETIPVIDNSSPVSHITRTPNSIFLRPASVNEVLTIIHNLDGQKSCGPDNIPVNVVKSNAYSFASILAEAFIKIISTGVYPDCLKVARVIPVFKSGDACDPCNYCPISTLSILNKVLERLLVVRLMDFLKASDMLYNFQ